MPPKVRSKKKTNIFSHFLTKKRIQVQATTLMIVIWLEFNITKRSKLFYDSGHPILLDNPLSSNKLLYLRHELKWQEQDLNQSSNGCGKADVRTP